MKEHVLQLKPTQIAVGYQQAKTKKSKLAKMKSKEFEKYLDSHAIPVIKGYDNNYFMIDHHHLSHALHSMRIEKVPIRIIKDYSDLEYDAFWEKMYEEHYVWPYDENGKKLSLSMFVKRLPHNVTQLQDDPYRSLAGIIRKRGAYIKDWTPFSEFHWANFLRDRIDIKDEIKDKHIEKAMELAYSADASSMPGYQGL